MGQTGHYSCGFAHFDTFVTARQGILLFPCRPWQFDHLFEPEMPHGRPAHR
ncbi:hypothetical protein Z950_2036 [Sulfitobacter mediterraneus KCTC 32188]|nr:hypothetical protein Z950_2036 [Sulfitobacter mediterraneus KCTC 32188]